MGGFSSVLVLWVGVVWRVGLSLGFVLLGWVVGFALFLLGAWVGCLGLFSCLCGGFWMRGFFFVGCVLGLGFVLFLVVVGIWFVCYVIWGLCSLCVLCLFWLGFCLFWGFGFRRLWVDIGY